MEIQGIMVSELAARYGTPLYIYDAESIQCSYLTLKKTLPNNVDVFFSLKANPNLTLSSILRKLGAGAEVCSAIELETALRAGFKPKNIIFVGPAKTEQDILQCLGAGIYAIVCESITEFNRIAKIAAAKQQIAPVMLRINPPFESKTAALKMGGRASQFGLDVESILANRELFLNPPHIKLLGIHIYNGTRILDAKTIAENTANIFALSLTLARELNCQWEAIDIGGGLGVPYFENETALDLAILKQELKSVVANFRLKQPHTRILLESGRFLTAPSGTFLCRIIDIKKSKQENFIITDGGMNCHMAASGAGTLIKQNFPIELITANKKLFPQRSKYHITGPLCTPGDVIGRNVSLPIAQVGDYIAVKASGAYGPTASPILFLSHGFPTEILIKEEKAYLLRERWNAEDILCKQVLI